MDINNNLILEWTYTHYNEPTTAFFHWIFPISLSNLFWANYTWGKNNNTGYASNRQLTPAFDYFNGTSVNFWMWNETSIHYLNDGFAIVIGS